SGHRRTRRRHGCRRPSGRQWPRTVSLHAALSESLFLFRRACEHPDHSVSAKSLLRPRDGRTIARRKRISCPARLFIRNGRQHDEQSGFALLGRFPTGASDWQSILRLLANQRTIRTQLQSLTRQNLKLCSLTSDIINVAQCLLYLIQLLFIVALAKLRVSSG